MLPVALHIPVAGSYSSALAKMPTSNSKPPATSTCPLGSNVAVWLKRGVVMLRGAVHTPVAGPYSSALAKSLLLFRPPATSTCALGSQVAVWRQRGVPRSPVAVHIPPVACAGIDELSSTATSSPATALLMEAKAKTRPAA